jgi:hypothetical protein
MIVSIVVSLKNATKLVWYILARLGYLQVSGRWLLVTGC